MKETSILIMLCLVLMSCAQNRKVIYRGTAEIESSRDYKQVYSFFIKNSSTRKVWLWVDEYGWGHYKWMLLLPREESPVFRVSVSIDPRSINAWSINIPYKASQFYNDPYRKGLREWRGCLRRDVFPGLNPQKPIKLDDIVNDFSW